MAMMRFERCWDGNALLGRGLWVLQAAVMLMSQAAGLEFGGHWLDLEGMAMLEHRQFDFQT